MSVRLFRRRTIRWPTWVGWLCLLPLLGALPAWWWFSGESFLSLTTREPAEVLVVEGWIGRTGVAAAKAEFETGGYRWLVATGGTTREGGWVEDGWSFAVAAEEELLRLGVPREAVVIAPAGQVESQRTYRSAMATREALAARGIRPRAVNILTEGPHGRRSRLVFARVLGRGTRVGVVSWQPPEDRHGHWWQSSERAKDLVTETTGYWFELLAGSGRWISGTTGEHPERIEHADPRPARSELTATRQSP